MLVVVCADKGSPGVTTTALAMAAAWPTDVVLVEADAAGGDLSLLLVDRVGRPLLSPAPTVAALAADGRGEAVLERSQNFGGLKVIPGYLAPEAGRGMVTLWGDLAATLSSAPIDAVVDLGRIDTSSPAMPILREADVVVVVSSPDLVSVAHTRSRVTYLQSVLPGVRIQPVVVTRDRDARSDVRELDEIFDASQVEAAPATHLPWDPATVAAVCSGAGLTSKVVARSRFMRAADVLVARVAVRTEELA